MTVDSDDNMSCIIDEKFSNDIDSERYSEEDDDEPVFPTFCLHNNV